MTLCADKTVREYAVETPNATRVFEKLKIDYCCGGGRSLGDACAAAGVGVEEVARLLEQAHTFTGETPEGLRSGTLAELIDYILDKHHAFTRDELDRLSALAEKVASKHGANHPELTRVRALFAQLCDDLRPHMFKEEMILFPYVKQMEQAAANGRPMPYAPFGTVGNPVRVMMSEHDTAGDILRELRATTADYTAPADACVSYQTLYRALEELEKDLHQHIHLENNILFPRAVELEGA
ncbi:MAG TPA: iron-sulfur cluster repair di-iron protein [Pyrinomonadaceae bacterium]|jgi:regulator of cell morphogenesis and NO signaling|nr:iron-sulfur cluster repair di-iron protein [Pyrinomonadaceae bacterium]